MGVLTWWEMSLTRLWMTCLSCWLWRLPLVGDVAHQALDNLLVLLALALALAHDVKVLHQLPLHLGGQAVLVGLIVLRLPAGKQGVERLA